MKSVSECFGSKVFFVIILCRLRLRNCHLISQPLVSLQMAQLCLIEKKHLILNLYSYS